MTAVVFWIAENVNPNSLPNPFVRHVGTFQPLPNRKVIVPGGKHAKITEMLVQQKVENIHVHGIINLPEKVLDMTSGPLMFICLVNNRLDVNTTNMVRALGKIALEHPDRLSMQNVSFFHCEPGQI